MIPQQLLWNDADGQPSAKGGRLWLGPLDVRPSTVVGVAARVTVRGPSGTEYVTNQAATLEGPATAPTLDGIHKAGTGSTAESPVRVSSTTGITARMRLLVGSAAAGQAIELVRVRSVPSTTSLILWGPLLHDHFDAASVSGCRLYADIAGSSMTTRFRLGKGIWEWSSDGVNRNRVDEIAVDCVRHPQKRLAQEDDLRRVDTQVYTRLTARRDPEEALEEGWDEVARRIVSRGVWGFIDNHALRRPTALFALGIEAMSWGSDEDRAKADRWMAEADRILRDVIETNPSDPNEDGYQTTLEQPIWQTIRLARTT